METQDDLRGALDAAFDAAPAQTETVVEQPIEQVEQSTEAQRERDESGRFKAKDAQTQAVQEQPQETQQAEVKPVEQQEKQIDTTRAPSSWKKETAAMFATLPPEVQAEIHRRETDYHKGYGRQFEESPAYKQMAPLAEVGTRVQSLADQYKTNYERYGINGEQAIAELFKMDNDLRNAPPAVKQQKFQALAQHYGIDLAQQFAPEVAQLQQKMYDLEQQNKQYLEAQQRSQFESVATEIRSFAESPGHEYFDKVRGHMQALLQAGHAKDLQDAYDQAVYANPETRKSLLEQQTRAAQEQINAQRAKSAAVSVKGSTPASGMAGTPAGSLRDAISAAFEQT